MRNFKGAVLGAVGVLGSGAVLAAPQAAIDVADITASFANQVTPMTAVLTAVLGLSVLIAVFGYIKRTAR
ncbi:MAG: major capsid protein [Steroidobacteraceae bacterium]